MDLKTILEENKELIKSAKSLEELCAALKEKGCEVTEKALTDLLRQEGTAPLDDDALEEVAGGLSALNMLFLIGGRMATRNSLFGGAEAVTLEQRGNRTAQAGTLEQKRGVIADDSKNKFCLL